MANRPLAPGLKALTYIVFIVSLVWTAFFLAWVSLRLVDFGYPVLYRALDIEAHIARYGPENRFKHGFETTDRAQRLAIFGQIVDAIQAGGRGLEDIRYTDSRGRTSVFLRHPEVVHLRSVARLVDRLAWVSWLMLGGLVASLTIMRAARLPPPRPGAVAAWTGVVVTAAAAFTLAWGPEEVFNTLHTWVFPAGEQWFFYYQESLMTTLMKAPDLFGAIAILLLLAALIYGAAIFAACRLWLLRQSAATPGQR
ncbi:MAG TPA: DUF1461 domain-containing protein [Gammaproteobacteria bacterium]|nr:DUF1461 domain-containing protein [Gammaproteobacteria bacterium]